MAYSSERPLLRPFRILARPSLRRRRLIDAVAAFTFGLLFTSLGQASEEGTFEVALARGDRAWEGRGVALDASGERAEPSAVLEAIEAYGQALDAEPDSLEARWKRLRALHYSVDFSSLDESARDANAEAAIELAKASLDLLDRVEGASYDRARVYFWSSIAWAMRADRVGLLTLVREGVAGRIRDYARLSIDLDESVDGGGALRLLSHLHRNLPRVPFVSGWVDRDEAMPLAERAVALDPTHPGSQLILALTILDLEPARVAEARAALDRVASSAPRAAYRVEDLRLRAQAKERLAALEDQGGDR